MYLDSTFTFHLEHVPFTGECEKGRERRNSKVAIAEELTHAQMAFVVLARVTTTPSCGGLAPAQIAMRVLARSRSCGSLQSNPLESR
ncbi:hypothetical protein NPIL_561621 [Nephila pilipes]|uniref:Uncharacterized protein n=1 Tax=Nephila pilipes TaxID=299642 RepID=A0A8X6MXZ0_NEPPI|nr:hypothetical protein NPIL_561621 [Nephila pilipes]